MRGIAEGLAYLHKQNVVHADMKAVRHLCIVRASPRLLQLGIQDNVLVDAGGIPRICDFGISHVITASNSASKSHGMRGSLRWMSVELFDFSQEYKDHTNESDVWAFGMTICVRIASSELFLIFLVR